MKKQSIKSFLGYCLAAVMIPLALVTLMGMQPISEFLVKVTGVKISPWFTGGEVVQIIEHGNYQTHIHRPVFDALIGTRKAGFVQIVWTPTQGLSSFVTEEIDYDGDKQPDFSITIDTQNHSATWKAFSPGVVDLQGPYEIGDGIGIRMKLIRR